MEDLVVRLRSANNDVRKRAELDLESALLSPEQTLPELTALIAQGRETTTREMAAILFRRYAFGNLDDNNSLWAKLSPAAAAQIKAGLIGALQVEKAESVASKICDAISQTARYLQKLESPWPELLNFLFQCTTSDNPLLREAVWRVLGALPTLFGDQQERYEPTIHNLLLAAINDVSTIRIRVAASKAAVSFIREAVDVTRRKPFSDIIPALLQSIVAMLQNNHEETARTILEEIIDLADNSSSMFRQFSQLLVNVVVSIVENTNAENKRKPTMMRNTPTFVARTLRAILMLMTEINDDPEWYTGDEIVPEDSDANSLVGEQALDRLAKAIRGKALLPPANELLAVMFQDPNWTHRHAALLTVSAMAEGCVTEMSAILPSIVARIVQFADDPHPRVRHALCNCIGQLCYDFAPKFQRRYADQIIPCLLKMLDDVGNPRVHTHAAAAIINFVTDSEYDDDEEDEDDGGDYQSPVARAFAPYSDLVLEKLMNLMASAQKRYVLEQAVDTLAAIAEIAGKKFAKHYSNFMQPLANILMRAQGKENRLLRGKVIECITLIGVAVGVDLFRADAKKIMEVLVQTNPADMDADDPQLSYVLLAYGRVASLLKEDFLPYLPHVMPDVLRSAGLQIDVAILNDDQSTDQYDRNDGWQVIQLDDKLGPGREPGAPAQNVCIKTSTLDEKMNGIQMIMTFAKALGQHFAPHADECFSLLLPLLTRYLDDNCRIVAGACISPLLNSLVEAHADPQILRQYWQASVQAFTSAIRDEADPEVVRGFMEGLNKAIETMGDQCLNDTELVALTETFHIHITDFLERYKERIVHQTTSDPDPEEIEELENEDEIDNVMMAEMTDTVRVIFKTHGTRYLQPFSLLIQALSTLMEPTQPEAHQKWALCFYDDVIEFGGPSSAQLGQYFLAGMQAGLASEHASVRQAAAYGFGAMAQHGGNVYTTICFQALPSLYAIIQHEEARADENVHATENAIAAVFKICKYQGRALDLTQVMPTLIGMLPVTEDEDEAEGIYDYFCELVEASNPALLGPSNQNLPQIVFILSEAILSQILASESAAYKRCVVLLRSIHQQVPTEAHGALWAKVDPKARDVIISEVLNKVAN